MSALERVQDEEERVIQKYTRYLNGPLGRTVLENLEEGESFLLQTSKHTMRITKRRGRAVVTLITDTLS